MVRAEQYARDPLRAAGPVQTVFLGFQVRENSLSAILVAYAQNLSSRTTGNRLHAYGLLGIVQRSLDVSKVDATSADLLSYEALRGSNQMAYPSFCSAQITLHGAALSFLEYFSAFPCNDSGSEFINPLSFSFAGLVLIGSRNADFRRVAMHCRWLEVFVLATIMLFVTSCGGGSKQPASPAPVPTKIQITSAASTLLLGKTQQLVATVTFSNGSTQNSPSGITWNSSDNSIATVSATGLVTPVALGNVTISAAFSSLSGSASLTVQTVLATLDRSTTVAGTDANGNGVRDDIDQVIASYSLGPNQKKAATQYAAALQVAVLNTVDPNSGFSNAVEIQRGQECMAQQIGAGYTSYARQLRAFTFNTQQRITAYINFEHNIGGTVFPRITGTVCK